MTEPSLPEESIFAQALEIASTAERAAFLDRACGDNQPLRAEIEALLRASQKSGDLLDLPENAAVTSELPVPEGSGTIIGPYKLLEQIGEGGMGTVWMAEQTDPIQRRVAVKVVKEGMDSRQVLARFDAERQALALMEHPNIAKVLDAGRTPSGRPYFVMELVKGQPITKYCDEKRLGVRERLELFGDVCRAVQHAHQKGIIHRDLKPSNVLVAPYDGKPVVKVIDFGVAKATGQRLTDKTLFTGFGALVGTPEYMSPEQAEVNNQDIDTRSDIYSLGVLLYELLTGSTPLTRKRIKEAALLEVLRVIREEEPPRPSTRLSESKDSLPSISAQRQTEPAKLTKLVRGELDWIAMKALEKDRNRRYETANGFAMDIQRYLADQAVLACPPSMRYRVGKFLRRHRGPVLAATIFVLLLGGGVVGTATGLVRALAAEQQALSDRDDKEKARRAAREALNTMTDAVMEDLLGRQAQLTEEHRTFLNKVLAQHTAFTAAGGDNPEDRESRAQAYVRVGRIRYFLGELKDAESAFREALALNKTLAADFPKPAAFRHGLAGSYNNLAILLRNTGRDKEAEDAYGEALTIYKQLTAEFPERLDFLKDQASSQSNLGVLLFDTGRLKEGEEAHRRALALRKTLAAESRKSSPTYRQDLAASQSNMGILFFDTGRLKEAEEAHRAAVALWQELASEFPRRPDFQHDLSGSHGDLAKVLADTGRLKEAESSYDDALAILKELSSRFPNRPAFRHDLARTHGSLAFLLGGSGRAKEAEAAFSAAVAITRQLSAELPRRPELRHDLAVSLLGLANLLITGNRLADAEVAVREALAVAKKLAAEFRKRPDFQQNLAMAQNYLGMLLHSKGRSKEAETVWREALAIRKQLADQFSTRPDFRNDLASTYNNLGGLLHATGRPKEAEAAWHDALVLRKELAAKFPTVAEYQDELAGTLRNLAVVHKKRQEFAAAVSLLEEGRRHRRAALDANPKNPTYADNYRNDLLVLAECQRGLADHTRLAATATELARLGREPAIDNYKAACHLCACVKLAEKDARLDQPKRKELAGSYADQALALLQQAIGRGFKDAAQMRQDPDLEPLRMRQAFRELLAELEGKAKK